MEQINGTVQNSAMSASQGAQLAHETSVITRRSNEAVQAVAQTMEGIADSSRRIGDIIRLIEGVAFQTNILALNAAVEAARAGEAGRGFAVVASEVRSLAQRAAEAAKEIKQLIVESGERVQTGKSTTEEARSRMNEVLSSVTKVGMVLDEISSTASEQKIGVSQVNEAVAHMDSITQQNAAMVEERPPPPSRYIVRCRGSAIRCACSGWIGARSHWRRWTPWHCAGRIRWPCPARKRQSIQPLDAGCERRWRGQPFQRLGDGLGVRRAHQALHFEALPQEHQRGPELYPKAAAQALARTILDFQMVHIGPGAEGRLQRRLSGTAVFAPCGAEFQDGQARQLVHVCAARGFDGSQVGCGVGHGVSSISSG